MRHGERLRDPSGLDQQIVKTPFDGETPQGVLDEIVQREPRPPLGAGSRVPVDLRVIAGSGTYDITLEKGATADKLTAAMGQVEGTSEVVLIAAKSDIDY